MKADKKARIKNKAQGRKINETVKTINIVNLVIIVAGFFLMILNYNELLTRIGQGLIMAGALLIMMTIVFQIMMANKMRRG
ncbi:MAG: hypothetical protein LBE57_02680 [Methanosarcinales archaeon]|jgi:hypothetical protein|nr:hypothetical protein [Methanosarcinales archaeon]